MVQEDKPKDAKKKQNTVNIKKLILVIYRSPLKCYYQIPDSYPNKNPETQ